MNKKFKILSIIIIFTIVLLVTCKVSATTIADDEIKISQNYLEYLELTDEEKESVLAPLMYDVQKSSTKITNPFRLGRLLGSSIQTRYSLKDIIPENMIIKNQLSTEICWAFSSLASLETNLALQDYKNNRNAVVYDFSERHMDYATTNLFLNGETNEYGFNRKPGSTGVIGIPISYLTNGLGAIAEEEMEFQDNVDLIDISEIQNKNVITQVNDIITFPSYTKTDDKTQIIKQMKEHIMNYGGISASINATANKNGAVYCSNSYTYKINHAVTIVGWDDEYSIENFNEFDRPTNNGAWIAKNSYGEEIGDEGFWYISYEDANVYKQLIGIQNAQTEINYENIYQYDELGGYLNYTKNGSSKVYLATEFDKKTTGKEYLTQIAINAAETYKCKVYVNPNGISKDIKDLQQVELKTGDTVTFDAGYHTIEFAKPIKVGENFVVVLEIEGNQENSITLLAEVNFGEFFTDPIYANAANHMYDTVTISDGKCFFGEETEFYSNQLVDTSKVYELSEGKLPNFDTTIKAFTTTKVLEKIEVTTQPNKTTYIEGQDFDNTGMQVKGYYANGDTIDIYDYTIIDGDNLTLGQTEITIVYQEFETTQPIEVAKNTVENIIVKTQPKKLEYFEGENFDSSEMIIEATYKDGSKKNITDYTIENGTNLKKEQSSVIIVYDGKTVAQPINVKENTVVKLEVISNANKLQYVAGQNFNAEGLVIKATYENGMEKQVTEYIVKDGTNLKEGQTTVLIEFEGHTVTQEITVEAKTIVSISVKTEPNKTEYLQKQEELDLTGGIINILYNDGTEEEIAMTSSEIKVEGFSNEEVGTNIITINYQNKTVQFNVEIKELPKPENSNFDNAQCEIKRIRAYYSTNKDEKEYVILNIEANNIIMAKENDNIEYYYYLSSNPDETSINKWVKIKDSDTSENQITFEINTLNIYNYEEIINSNEIYLYIKEVATKNDMKAEKTINFGALKIENMNIEEYVDGEKKNDVNSDTVIDATPGENLDNTLAQGTIPNAGKNILIVITFLGIIIISIVIFLKYKDIEIK